MQENMFGQNIIITERVSTLRQLGRNAIKGKWMSAIMACVIYLICLNVPVTILNKFFGYNPGNIVASDGYTYGLDAEKYMEFYNSIPRGNPLSAAYVLLVGGAFALGLCLFFLASFRGHNVYPKDVFLGFERFGKALGLFLYKSMFIFLWSLLFIIPGIIAAIRYSQAFYVLADDPEKSIKQCMDESKMMMKGNKGKYFVMNLSFIGWFLLASIPAGVLQGIITSFSDSNAAQIVIQIVTILFMAPVMSYVYSTDAGFYEILSGHLIKETAPAPITPEQIAVDAPVEAIEEVIETVENDEKNSIDVQEHIDEEVADTKVDDVIDDESEGKE